MEFGGNKNAAVYFEKNGMMADGKPNHKHPALAKYKQDLLKKAEQAVALLMGNFTKASVEQKAERTEAKIMNPEIHKDEQLTSTKNSNVIQG